MFLYLEQLLNLFLLESLPEVLFLLLHFIVPSLLLNKELVDSLSVLLTEGLESSLKVVLEGELLLLGSVLLQLNPLPLDLEKHLHSLLVVWKLLGYLDAL